MLSRLEWMSLLTRQVAEALGRIDNGTYGLCLRCGQSIWRETPRCVTVGGILHDLSGRTSRDSYSVSAKTGGEKRCNPDPGESFLAAVTAHD
jgi:hypothetical protein